jgi:hypothetical protein
LNRLAYETTSSRPKFVVSRTTAISISVKTIDALDRANAEFLPEVQNCVRFYVGHCNAAFGLPSPRWERAGEA